METEEIIQRWVRLCRSQLNPEELTVGQDISVLPEVKIAFDGYAETEHGDEDLTSESYAIYIHKESAERGFVFPEHEASAWASVRRPDQEVCHFVWYDSKSDTFDGPMLQDACEECDLSVEEVSRIVSLLAARHLI